MDKFLAKVPGNRAVLKKFEEKNNKPHKEAEKVPQPWIEKYRPNTLKDVVSQDMVINSLTQTKETGRMQHLLFYGPPGTGKTSTIIALARDLFGANNYRQRILELNASDERGIQVIREKVKTFAQKKIVNIKDCKAEFQIVILDEADSMTADAQSALRRIIEDYTESTRFCIICNYVSKIIDPVASRCARFRFKSLDKESQMKRLTDIATSEGLSITRECLEFLEFISKGDLRRSINLLQTISHLGADYFKREYLEDICGYISDDEVSKFYNKCESDIFKNIYQYGKEFLTKGYDLRQFIYQLNKLTIEKEIDIKKANKLFNIYSECEKLLLSGSTSDIIFWHLFAKMNLILNP